MKTNEMVVVAIGTRPDVLKMEPVINALKEAGIEHKVWWSGQGGDIQPSVKDSMEVKSGKNSWMIDNLASNIAETTEEFSWYLLSEEPSLILVHGDDATAYACALAAHALDIPIGHVEAGMRTYERDPWPEEQFRQVISRLADLHFCPSHIEMANLDGECVGGAAHVVGNTINDVLARTHKFNVLVTCHRRENAGERRHNLLFALNKWADEYKDLVHIQVISHPNWPSIAGLWGNLSGLLNLDIIDPIRDHGEFVELMKASDVVVTDSGGLQEECVFLGVDCVVYRAQTERKLLEREHLLWILPDAEVIIDVLRDKLERRHMYGKGNAAAKIVEIVQIWLNVRSQRRRPRPPAPPGGRRAASWARLQDAEDEICEKLDRFGVVDVDNLIKPLCDCIESLCDCSPEEN